MRGACDEGGKTSFPLKAEKGREEVRVGKRKILYLIRMGGGNA